MRNIVYHILFRAAVGALFLFMFFSADVAAQENDVDTNDPPSRSINSLDFQSQRPKNGNAKKGLKAGIQPVSNAKRRKSIAVLTNPGRRYKWIKRVTVSQNTKIPSTLKTNTQIVVGGGSSKGAKINLRNKKPMTPLPLRNEEIGVTFWRLRRLDSDEREDAPTFPVNLGDDGVDYWTAERVSSTTKFRANDRLRFTIESSRTGFLYIINREYYADGVTGDAELIYPTLNTRNQKGDPNRVTAGSLIDVPPASQRFPYFRIEPKQKGYAGEEVVVIISPSKLPGINPSVNSLPLDREKVEKWLADWGGLVDVYDATDGEGVALTRNEADAVRTRALTQEEPLPQTIYRVKARANEPVVVVFQMQARK